MVKKNLLVHEAAERSGLHENTVRTYCDKQIIKSYRDLNNFRRIPESEVRRLEMIADGLLNPEE